MSSQTPFQDHQQFGGQLRRLREAQGLTLDEVVAQTKFPQRFIESLEKGEFAKLPLPFFTRNYIAGLCRFYGADPAPWLDYYGKVSGSSQPEPAPAAPVPVPGGSGRRPVGEPLMPAPVSPAHAKPPLDLANWIFFGGLICFGLFILVIAVLDSIQAAPGKPAEASPRRASASATGSQAKKTASEFKTVSMETFVQTVQVPVVTLPVPSGGTERR